MHTTMGLYRPGTSLLHRLPAGVKLLALVVFGIVSIWVQSSWITTLITLGVVASLYFAAGFTPAVLWRQIKPMFFLLAFMAVFHAWTTDWRNAVGLTGTLLAMVALAALVTLTTPTTKLIDAAIVAVKPLRRFGVDPERVGLMLTLGIRAVPLMVGLAMKVREAQIARSQTQTFRAFAVPLIVSALRQADAMGEALVARGVDD